MMLILKSLLLKINTMRIWLCSKLKINMMQKGIKVLWFFTENKYDANKKIYFSDNKYDADLLIFLTDNKYDCWLE